MVADSGVLGSETGAPGPRRPASVPPPPEPVLGRFRRLCVVRVLLLSATLGIAAYLAVRQQLLAAGGCAVLAAYQVCALIRYVDRTNRDLTRFLLAIRHSDFSQSFTGKALGAACGELRAAFTDVLSTFQAARVEKEEQARYLQTVVQHVGIGLLAFDRHGHVHLLNTAAKRLLSVARLRNIAELADVSTDLVTALRSLGSEPRRLVRVQRVGEVQQLALYGTVFRMRERQFTLASVQNIHPELEDKETEAWQNLVRVLTHEIMNSITPISSLAATAHGLLASASVDDDVSCDVREAVETIHRRSDGLLRFVEAYRRCTQLPTPRFQILPVAKAFERVQQLMAQQFAEVRAQLAVEVVPPQLEVTADPGLLEQALINLLRNALDAVHGRSGARVELRAGTDGRGHILVEVADNGHGIGPDTLERVFVPFYTTRQHGSGIGLALCRQIMRLHRGTITVQSARDVETVFTLRF